MGGEGKEGVEGEAPEQEERENGDVEYDSGEEFEGCCEHIFETVGFHGLDFVFWGIMMAKGGDGWRCC